MKTIQEVKGRCRIDGQHWIWTGAMTEDGWPRICGPDHTNHAGKPTTQHGRRAVYHMASGKPIPSGWRVFGTCEERSCVAPNHLECKPVAERGAEVAASGAWKGRVARVAANRATGRTRSSLTPELIALIYSSTKKGTELAAETGLSRSTVSRVRTGKALCFEPVGGLFTGLLAANQSNERRAA